MSAIRPVSHVVTAHRQREGGGFVVRRPLPTQGVDLVDPFLMIDEMGPVAYGPGQAVGAPDHPHRGFETVSYILEGGAEHEDSAGNKGWLGPGDVQWMTAGRGIVHSELPSKALREHGGRMHGFQVWVNLPKAHKMAPPRYQDLRASEIPRVTLDDGRAEVALIAGEAFGRGAAAITYTPIVYHDWTLRPGADVEVPLPADYNALVYVFAGSVVVGGRALADGQMGVLGAGDAARLQVPAGATGVTRLLLLGGRPLNEPVARYGPFVMNTVGEVRQAFVDFQEGRLGAITR